MIGRFSPIPVDNIRKQNKATGPFFPATSRYFTLLGAQRSEIALEPDWISYGLIFAMLLLILIILVILLRLFRQGVHLFELVRKRTR